jgi:hypothetical protein
MLGIDILGACDRFYCSLTIDFILFLGRSYIIHYMVTFIIHISNLKIIWGILLLII